MTPGESPRGPAGGGLAFELYHPRRGKWITIPEGHIEGRFVIHFEDKRVKDLDDGHIVMTRITSERGSIIRLLGRLEHFDTQERITSPDLIMRSDPGDDTRRRDFRIAGSTETVNFRIIGMSKDDASLEAEVDDVSAGGVGMIIPDELLQKIQLATRFHLELDLNPGGETPDLLPIEAVLRNVRPLEGDRYHYGLQFTTDNRDEATVRQDTSRLLRHVAVRQREELRRRARLDIPDSPETEDE